MQTQIALSQDSKNNIQNTAKNITIYFIKPDNISTGEKRGGSGVIVKREGSTYYVVTAWHVVCPPLANNRIRSCTEKDFKGFKVFTNQDRQEHLIESGSIKHIKKFDAALLQFKTNATYELAKLPDSSQKIEKDQSIYVSGSKTSTTNIDPPDYQFIEGNFVFQLDQINPRYRNNLIYETKSETSGGMSGGAIFDESSRLVGIHTGIAKNNVTGVGIQEIITEASKLGINLTSSTIAQEEKPTIQQPITFLPPSPVTGAEQKPPEVSPPTINTLNYGIKPEYGNPAALKVLLETKQCVWCNLNTARLSGADLSYAVLAATGLSGADLQNTNLSAANLVNVDLTQADLRGANLQGANLEGANLQGANLEGANLQGARMPDGKVHY